MKTSHLESNHIREILKSYSTQKKASEYSKISMFRELNKRENNTPKPIQIRKRLTPLYWNVEDSEIKSIKSRSRLEDFTSDSVAKLFPRKSPTFLIAKSGKLPALKPEEKFFHKKFDNSTLYREALIRLKKQGFFS